MFEFLLSQRSTLMDQLRTFEDAMSCNDNYMQCKEIDFMGINESLLGTIDHHWGCQYISALEAYNTKDLYGC